MQTLFVELEQCGLRILESQKVPLVLNSLDETWDIVSALFEWKPEQELSLEALKTCLIPEEQKRHYRKNHKEEKFLRRGAKTSSGNFHSQAVCREQYRDKSLAVTRDQKSSRRHQTTVKQKAQQQKKCFNSLKDRLLAKELFARQKMFATKKTS
uniref:Uncharacterized protein n=1 Tax=Micrurus spixii TaxID=129469 RepID=A0A2D4LRJ6_9SAUR